MKEKPRPQTREARPEDAATISRLMHRAFQGYEHLYTPEAYAATTPEADQIRARMEEDPVWVAEREGEIIGTLSAVVRQDGLYDGLYIRGMAVDPAARGHNIGRALIEQAEEFATKKGLTRIYVSTTPFLDAAIRLYERTGFIRSDQGPDRLFGTELFTMEKELSNP